MCTFLKSGIIPSQKHFVLIIWHHFLWARYPCTLLNVWSYCSASEKCALPGQRFLCVQPPCMSTWLESKYPFRTGNSLRSWRRVCGNWLSENAGASSAVSPMCTLLDTRRFLACIRLTSLRVGNGPKTHNLRVWLPMFSTDAPIYKEAH